ncbi:MAG: DUF1801 domain-containing protein [Sphingobacteriales bacterium JAD_PAG50586_3]|nr:MAG: DUF1801 domain-containing protein [Sphingobacteriales bacterium JAD_PAG50586_3]
MAELKTQENDASVEEYINATGNEKVIADNNILVRLMQKATGAKPKMWGDKIIGFGKYQYKSAATGKGGDWFIMGFAPRKASLALYLMSGYTPEVKDCLTRLGKHKLSGSCIHIAKLANVDVKVLEEMINEAAKVGPKYAA